MKKFDVEIIVGIFVFCGLLCLAYMSVRLGKINLLGDPYYPVNAVFSSVKGLKKILWWKYRELKLVRLTISS